MPGDLMPESNIHTHGPTIEASYDGNEVLSTLVEAHRSWNSSYAPDQRADGHAACTMLLTDVGAEDRDGIPIKESTKAKIIYMHGVKRMWSTFGSPVRFRCHSHCHSHHCPIREAALGVWYNRHNEWYSNGQSWRWRKMRGQDRHQSYLLRGVYSMLRRLAMTDTVTGRREEDEEEEGHHHGWNNTWPRLTPPPSISHLQY
jgi:hypothetical protein